MNFFGKLDLAFFNLPNGRIQYDNQTHADAYLSNLVFPIDLDEIGDDIEMSWRKEHVFQSLLFCAKRNHLIAKAHVYRLMCSRIYGSLSPESEKLLQKHLLKQYDAVCRDDKIPRHVQVKIGLLIGAPNWKKLQEDSKHDPVCRIACTKSLDDLKDVETDTMWLLLKKSQVDPDNYVKYHEEGYRRGFPYFYVLYSEYRKMNNMKVQFKF